MVAAELSVILMASTRPLILLALAKAILGSQPLGGLISVVMTKSLLLMAFLRDMTLLYASSKKLLPLRNNTYYAQRVNLNKTQVYEVISVRLGVLPMCNT